MREKIEHPTDRSSHDFFEPPPPFFYFIRFYVKNWADEVCCNLVYPSFTELQAFQLKHPSKLRKKKNQYFSLFEVKLHRIKAGNISFERALKTASNGVFYLFHMLNFFRKKFCFLKNNFLFLSKKF